MGLNVRWDSGPPSTPPCPRNECQGSRETGCRGTTGKEEAAWEWGSLRRNVGDGGRQSAVGNFSGEFGRHRSAVMKERRVRDHEGVTETAEVGIVFHLFGENVRRIDLAWDVVDGYLGVDVGLADGRLAEVDVLSTLVG